MMMIPAMFALFEWLKWWLELPPRPIILTAAAAIGIAIGAWRIFRIRIRLRSLRQGRDGEMAVGQFLERLREHGYQVFHDVIGEGFNVDHVLVGPAGVFTVETKTYSKRRTGESVVRATPDSLRIGELDTGTRIYRQCVAQAQWIRRILKESTGRTFHVQPTLVFPGWMVSGQGSDDVWVTNPRLLPGALKQRKVVNSPEDTKLASYHLSRHIRTSLDAVANAL